MGGGGRGRGSVSGGRDGKGRKGRKSREANGKEWGKKGGNRRREGNSGRKRGNREREEGSGGKRDGGDGMGEI